MRTTTTLAALAALTLLTAGTTAQGARGGPGDAQQGGGNDPGQLTTRPGDVVESSDTRPDGSLRQVTGRLQIEIEGSRMAIELRTEHEGSTVVMRTIFKRDLIE